MDKRTGKGKVMAEAAKEAEAPRAAVQLPLLGGSEAVDVVPAERRGRGRPAGSENLVTKELRAYVGANFRHPIITLARTQAQDPLVLAKAMGCKPIEALDRILRAATELMPYLVGKMPVEDAAGNAVLPVLNLVDPRLAAEGFGAADGGGRVLDLSALQVIDNQAFPPAPSAAVGQFESDSAAETEAQRGFEAGGACDLGSRAQGADDAAG